MKERLTVEFDGGSRGNPGPAAIGVVVRAEDGTPLVTLGRYIGRATNNVAEYKALIAGLQAARQLGATRVQVRGDSELIIKQVLGEYRVRHPDMKPLHAEAERWIDEFEEATITHNLRHKNELADKLANLAMDRRGEVTDADEAGGVPGGSAPGKGGSTGAARRFACRKCGCVIRVERAGRGEGAFVCACGQVMQTEE